MAYGVNFPGSKEKKGTVPFSIVTPDKRERTSVRGEDPPSAGTRLRELEARMRVLEEAIFEHALALRDRIGRRLDCLEDRLNYESKGLRRALKDESADRDEKIIQLTHSLTAAVDRVESNQQPAPFKETVDELVSALAATRAHLDGLAQAIQKAKG